MVEKKKIPEGEKRAKQLEKGLENILENQIGELEGTMRNFSEISNINICNTEAYQRLMNQYGEFEKSVKGYIQGKYIQKVHKGF